MGIGRTQTQVKAPWATGHARGGGDREGDLLARACAQGIGEQRADRPAWTFPSWPRSCVVDDARKRTNDPLLPPHFHRFLMDREEEKENEHRWMGHAWTTHCCWVADRGHGRRASH